MQDQKLSQIIDKTAFALTGILLVILPFHALLATVLNYRVGLDSILVTTWKEILFTILGICAFWYVLTGKVKLKFDGLTLAILAYLALGVLSYFLWDFEFGFKQWAFGARFDFAFLMAFLIARHLNFDPEQKNKLFNIVIYAGFAVVIYGLATFVFFLFVDPAVLTALGFRNDWSTFIPGEALAYCQRIENSSLCRLNATFAGPNQYGAFLIVLGGLIAPLVRAGEASKRQLYALVMFLIIASLVLTFSRSALIAFCVAMIALALGRVPKKTVIKAVGITVFAAVLLLATKNDAVTNLIAKPESTAGHFKNGLIAIQSIVDNPWGQGLGTVGPASSYFHKPGKAFHPENWYLQVGMEMGIIGSVLFVAILVMMLKKLSRCTNEKSDLHARQIFFGVLGISIMALFLHAFEDAPTTLTLFTLLGLVL